MSRAWHQHGMTSGPLPPQQCALSTPVRILPPRHVSSHFKLGPVYRHVLVNKASRESTDSLYLAP